MISSRRTRAHSPRHCSWQRARFLLVTERSATRVGRPHDRVGCNSVAGRLSPFNGSRPNRRSRLLSVRNFYSAAPRWMPRRQDVRRRPQPRAGDPTGLTGVVPAVQRPCHSADSARPVPRQRGRRRDAAGTARSSHRRVERVASDGFRRLGRQRRQTPRGASRKPPAGALPLPLRQSASNPPDPPNGLLTLSRAARHTSGVSWLGNRRLPRGDLVNHDP